MEEQDTFGKLIAPDTVRFERTLPGPIERVWEYLVDPEKRSKWLASGSMDLRVGGKVNLWFHHVDLVAPSDEVPERFKKYEKGSTNTGHITAIDPPNRLAFTWQDDGKPGSEVIFELKAEQDSVRLILTHRRLPDRAELVGVSGGWHTHLDILVDHLNGRTPQPFWTRHDRLDRHYDKTIPE